MPDPAAALRRRRDVETTFKSVRRADDQSMVVMGRRTKIVNAMAKNSIRGPSFIALSPFGLLPRIRAHPALLLTGTVNYPASTTPGGIGGPLPTVLTIAKQ
jgi:hypothetical protein